jgi:hypothetical protein
MGQVRNRHCPVCDDKGWVCKNHPDRPWQIVSDRWDACDCGPRAPCPTCNSNDRRPNVSRIGVEVTFGEADGGS